MMKRPKPIKLRMDASNYYIWVGGSCDYAHEERAGGGSYIMEKDGKVVERDSWRICPNRYPMSLPIGLLGITASRSLILRVDGYAPEKSTELIDFIHFYVLLGTNGHQKEAILALLAADCNPGKLNGYAPEYVSNRLLVSLFATTIS